MPLAVALRAQQLVGDFDAIHDNTPDALHDAFGILHFNVKCLAPEHAGDLETLPFSRNARIDAQAVVIGADAKNPLRDGEISPGGRAGESGIFRFAVGGRVFARDHLRENVGLAAMQIADAFAGGGIDAGVIIEGAVAIAGHRFSDDDPGVVVTENTGVFLVAGRVGGNLAHFNVIFGEDGIEARCRAEWQDVY